MVRIAELQARANTVIGERISGRRAQRPILDDGVSE